MTSRKCMVSGCTRHLYTGSVMCAHHWHQVPTEVKREVYKRLKYWQNDGLGAAQDYLRHHSAVKEILRGDEKICA